MAADFANPFRPGAGHPPPFLAGRSPENREFLRIIEQRTIIENLVLTGLRGVGKTVLLDSFKPQALQKGWRWVGTDLSEASSLTEERLAIRLLADLAVATADLELPGKHGTRVGFGSSATPIRLGYETLTGLFSQTPGLISDKLKFVLETAWTALQASDRPAHGIVFAYDEAQNLADHAKKDEFPMSLILDVFQSIQKKGVPFMLVLTGLPTLFPKLVESRTYSERMFRVVFLDRLQPEDSREAIVRPISRANCPVRLNEESVELITEVTRGYPYFIQFVCREVFDIFLLGQSSVPIKEITQKLDTDFFAGRWARATDRQRELLWVISCLPSCDDEFTVQQVVNRSMDELKKPFGSSHTNQMLSSLSNNGLIYRNRHGRYSFAVPLLGGFIQRQGPPDGATERA